MILGFCARHTCVANINDAHVQDTVILNPTPPTCVKDVAHNFLERPLKLASYLTAHAKLHKPVLERVERRTSVNKTNSRPNKPSC